MTDDAGLERIWKRLVQAGLEDLQAQRLIEDDVTDDAHGEQLPEETQKMLGALRYVPLAAVRRAFPEHRPGACVHPAERLQPYSALYDLCLDCGQMVGR